MDDLRARLDAPLFHRDQGLATPAQLPRLRELSFDEAEVPLPLAVPDVPAVTVPAVTTPAVEAVVVDPPAPPAPVAPSARPKLASFSELMAATAAAPAPTKEPEIEPSQEQLPAPLPKRIPQAMPEPMPVADVLPAPAPAPAPAAAATQGVLASPAAATPAETEALLAVLAAFETSSNKMHETNLRASIIDTPVTPAAVMPLPVAELNITPAHGQRSSIEAELNRLAFLPDQEEPIGRVEVPQIAIAHVEYREPSGVPMLSQHEMYSPRATPTMPTAKRAAFEAAFEGSQSRRGRGKKGVVRRLVSAVLVVGVLGGGLFAAKYYLLDPKWDPDVKMLADDVEAARRIEFDHAVEVTALSADDYATHIASYALDIQGGNQEKVGSEFRALGLLNGVLDLRAIGLAALPETPAYYDAGSEKIFVVTGLPDETYRFAMYRALTAALLDQEYGWNSRISDAAPSVVRGTRALYEADALATASSMLTPSDRALVVDQRTILYTTFSVPATPSQFASTVAGLLGVSLRAFVEAFPPAERDRMLRDATITDGQALDLRRLVRGVADGTQVAQEALRQETLPGTGSQGMLFWYHVLASRLDVATAWNNALPIQADDVVVTPGATGYCITALLTVPPAALDGVNAAFTAWASAAPPASATTVVPTLVDGIAHITISACDLGLSFPTNNGQLPLSLGGAPLRSEQFRLLLIAQPTLTKAQAACAVYGGDTVSVSDERLVADAIEGWSVPAAHPAPDPTRAECAAA